jgi:thiamine kinase-like enzyme
MNMNDLAGHPRWNELKARIPLLSAALRIESLKGGLTNSNYKLETDGHHFVLRMGNGSANLLGIDRFREASNSKLANLSGVAPEVIRSLPGEEVMIIKWIEGKTLHSEDLQAGSGMLSRIADAIRRLHAGKPFEGRFNFTTLRRSYLKKVKEAGYFIPDQYLEMEPMVIELEHLINDDPEPMVSCHNDLLAENFMDDGSKIWIIDYEYSGQNEASFDIGNLAGESLLNDEAITELCDAYWNEHRPEKIARALAWSMISRYGWVMWASIQDAISPIAFDFKSWGMEKWSSVHTDIQGDRYREVISMLKKHR